MPPDANSSLLALRAQQSAEIKRLNATFDYAQFGEAPRGFLSGGTPRPLTKTQRLVRQPTYTRKQLLPSNFTKFLVAKQWGISEATTVPHAELVAMLDRDHPEGARFAVVCKNSTRNVHVVTALDLQGRRFYRSISAHGVHGFWKYVSRRRPEVQLLSASDSFEG